MTGFLSCFSGCNTTMAGARGLWTKNNQDRKRRSTIQIGIVIGIEIVFFYFVTETEPITSCGSLVAESECPPPNAWF